MARILILFAHPLLEKSRVHSELIRQAKGVEGVRIHDLYEQYPDFDIDVAREKRLLMEHELIIWQHPFYWYSAPPLLKQWQDLVLEHGWAYGKKGNALTGKKIFNVLTTGGSAEAYAENGYNRYSIRDFLRPFEQTAVLCRMEYWPPYWVAGVHRMDEHRIQQHGEQYRNLLTAFSKEIYPDEEIFRHELLNHLFPLTSTSF